MRRVFPYLAAAVAGAAALNLAVAQAQVPRRDESVRLVEGFSDRGGLQAALDDATNRALRGLPGADRQIEYKVREITGVAGGIRGGNRVRVVIEVPQEGDVVEPDRPDRPERPERPQPGDDLDQDALRNLRTDVHVPREVDRGEAVPVELVLTNRSDNAVRIPLNTGQKYEFEIWQGNKMVWRWSQGRFFTQVLGNTVIQPNEEVTYRIQWDQRNADGQRVPAGTYQVRAYVPTRSADFKVGSSATFSIN